MSSEPFAGRIGITHARSSPAWPARAPAPPGAPNVVVIVLDDVGFAQLGCYGSDIQTPNIDDLAAGGLRFTSFHTNAVCTPSRASLLTGRNAHLIGMATVSASTGFPGYHGHLSLRAATLAELLGDAGFGCYALGKWHLTALVETGPAGPFRNWPLGRGFDRFYGFLGGVTDGWSPALVEDNHPIDPPSRPGYHLSEDLVDRSIEVLRTHRSAAADRPFFLYLAFAAAHWPLHVPRAWTARYRGRFDEGWDVARARWLERQKQLGVVPAGTRLPPGDPDVPAWTELSPDERRVCARLQEVFAASLSHADAQIGRLLAHLRQAGLLDDTLVILLSDNGADGRGGRTGRILFHEESLEDALGALDAAGDETTFPFYPAGWAQAGNTPLRWYKHDTYAGGIRDPLIVHWPGRMRDPGGLRTQYHHVTDIVPTVLEAVGITPPETRRGLAQLPITGTSFAYTFDDPGAATRKTAQYYESSGSRGMWVEGWTAVTHHAPGADIELEPWSLYRDDDVSQIDDRADDDPSRLRELIARWWMAAGVNNVLPLDDRRSERHADVGARIQQGTFVFHQGMARIEDTFSPLVDDRSHSIVAEVEAPASAEGILLASGGRFGGYVLYVREGRLVYEYNRYGRERTRLVSDVPVPSGARRLAFRFERTAPCEGTGTLLVDGRCAGSATFRTMRLNRPTEGLYCGREAGTPVGTGYRLPFAFTGRIHCVRVEAPDT